MAVSLRSECKAEGEGSKRSDGPPFVEATVVLTNLDTRTNVTQGSNQLVGEVPTGNNNEDEFRRICLTSKMEDISNMLQEKGCVVKKGRWVP